MINISKYNLPDIQLFEKNNPRFSVWIPDKTYIILGASNQPEESLFAEKVIQDQITVMKRSSGGQTVLLTPNNLIISIVFDSKKKLQPKEIFNRTNATIILAMEEAGIKGLSLNGISDIAISGKKILGSAMYQNKDLLLYHAVLNLGEPASTFEKYLKHPVKEPDYRNGRKHADFVSSLKENGYTGDYPKIAQLISNRIALSLN